MDGTVAYIGLGSNLDDPAAQVARALDELAAIDGLEVTACSRLYHNPPMGPQDQPDYINAVARVLTRLPAEVLLDELLAIEQAHGRVRGGEHWGPRTLDLDLLVYGEAVIETGRLTVPHPGLAERAFVLYPLQEIEPGLRIPRLGALAELCRRCPRDGLRPLDPVA
ncbi:MAG TPA: 2-amino-4-hydroxy-6-hydroxymethyldihydropteridine diphosphokinase [Thioalkalivibrio sp.]|nr:2-amino-4-hydroxy-6-hydroxymethyldihydropteridine diphosphokinase [Thioalkalivibrio sp.]